MPRPPHELLIGPVYYRLLLSGRPLDRAFAKRNVEVVLRAFAPGSPPG